MIELSVGQVAGIIAAATAFVRIICPLALTFLLANEMRDTESASTWSLAGQALQSTYWPTILQSDGASSSSHVRRPIRLLSASITLLAILAAVSGVVTPLGLGEKWTAMSAKTGTFEYAHDTSSFAIATSPRGNGTFHRTCEEPDFFNLPCPCPYTGDTMNTTVFKNGTILRDFPYGLHTPIPDVLRDIFSSGTAGQRTTISNVFDIEWRQLSSTGKSDTYDNGTARVMGMYRQLDSILLQDEYKVFEGLVVDNKRGGIGFRNHTVPIGLNYGASWKEDLLFMEPDVSCVNTNISMDFEISNDATSSSKFRKLVITDRGGFVGLNATHLPIRRPKSQVNPDLQARAYDAAVLNNAYTMMIFNVTGRFTGNSSATLPYSYLKSARDMEFPLNRSLNSYTSLELTNNFGSYFYTIGWNFTDYPNPFNITGADLEYINSICTGADDNGGVSAKHATISNVYVACGLLRGTPVRVDAGSPFIFDDGSNWSSQLYACAATVRATIKTVDFLFNATDRNRRLDKLMVTAISQKTYANEAEVPLWGFEESGRRFDAIAPLWGLISSHFEAHQNLSSVRQPFFNIPGSMELYGYLPTYSNVAGSLFAGGIMNQVFHYDDQSAFDLQGRSSMAVFRRWQSLSQDASSAAKIIKLRWTDLAASAVVGTKGTLGHLNKNEESESVRILVTPTGRSISYHIPYGIPAFLLLFCLTIIGVVSLVGICFRSAGIGRIRLRIQQTSAGRAYTTHLYPEESSLSMTSREWRQRNGSRPLKITGVCQKGDLSDSEG